MMVMLTIFCILLVFFSIGAFIANKTEEAIYLLMWSAICWRLAGWIEEMKDEN